MPTDELRSLRGYLQTIPDFRKRRGQRYGIACYMTIMIAVRVDDERLWAIGGFLSPGRRRFTAPAALDGRSARWPTNISGPSRRELPPMP